MVHSINLVMLINLVRFKPDIFYRVCQVFIVHFCDRFDVNEILINKIGSIVQKIKQKVFCLLAHLELGNLNDHYLDSLKQDASTDLSSY